MLEAKEASFSFEGFRVPKFFYDEGNQSDNVRLGFSPSGKYNSATGEFELTLLFITHEVADVEKTICELTSIAIFKFDPHLKLKDLPPFFYKNAIAIMFPYVRAFVSTITLQANTKLLKLGLMNLSELEKPLLENTVEV